MTTTADILERAAARIERDGWWQHRRPVDGDGCCLVTAIHTVCAHDATVSRVSENYIREVIAEHVGIGTQELLADWNDAPGRTAEEVIAALRACAAAERAKA